jgi:hypothetical protein
MTEWILITMLCTRNCLPQYAEIYPNKAACVEKLTKPESAWSLPANYCIPLVKEKNT